MKTSTCSARDLTALIQHLRDNGVFINEGQLMGEVFICENYTENTGGIIFGAKPVGRKGDEIWYELKWTDKFDAFMGTASYDA